MPKDAKFKIDCVDALALFHALKRLSENHTGVTDVRMDKTWLTFTVERYAMNGAGFHAGYEQFTGVLDLYMYQIGIRHNAVTPDSMFYVIPETLDVEGIIPAEEPHEYTQEEALQFLREYYKDADKINPDGLLQVAFDRGLGDGDYFPPDDDFAYQELEWYLQEALSDLPGGQWDPDTQKWSLRFADGETVEL